MISSSQKVQRVITQSSGKNALRLPAIPQHIMKPSYALDKTAKLPQRQLRIKTGQEIQRARDAAAITRDTLAYVGSLVREGVSTLYLNEKAHNYIIERNAYPSPLLYQNFQASICTSVNNVVCHGIPHSDCILQDGDLVSVDVTCFYRGMHGDACRTFTVGDSVNKLAELSRQCTLQTIDLAKPNLKVCELGAYIEDFCDEHGVSSVRELCGHGIGVDFHELPYVLHHKNNDITILRPGMIFTVEPMLCEKEASISLWESDGWTIVTEDDGWCAQHEETVLVTDNGYEILTKDLD